YYTERYIGLPSENVEGYKASSVLTYVNQLARPLLLIHGLTDDNVYFQHAVQLADALYMAGKPYEFLPMLGTHMAGASDPTAQPPKVTPTVGHTRAAREAQPAPLPESARSPEFPTRELSPSPPQW